MKEKICQLHCKKHIKIWKLHELGIPNKEIAQALGTNAGHVYNVLKEYGGSETKREAANKLNVVDEDERSVAIEAS